MSFINQKSAKERTFSAGNYTVGNDIDAGTCNIIAVAGLGNCFIYDSSKDLIVGESFVATEEEFFIKEYKNVDLSSGHTIEITSSLKLCFVPVK